MQRVLCSGPVVSRIIPSTFGLRQTFDNSKQRFSRPTTDIRTRTHHKDIGYPQPKTFENLGRRTTMGSSNLLLIFANVASLAMIHPTIAQNSAEDFVSAHNAARAAVGVGPVSWDDTVASYAQNYASQRIGDCELVHSGGPYGENIFWGSGSQYTAADAMNFWVSEKQYYDHDANSCAAGQQCMHYTQVVWRDSTNIGCARVECNSGGIFITCNYSPFGNVAGRRPY